MRNEKNMLDAFMPLHEKEWESRLFIDEAIKNKTEYHLETIARALSGKHTIKFSHADKNKPFKHVKHIESDSKGYVTKTKNYKIEARMNGFVFYGNNKIEVWLKVIDFWAGRKKIWPCGGASEPNNSK